jgi:hypothetical protein
VALTDRGYTSDSELYQQPQAQQTTIATQQQQVSTSNSQVGLANLAASDQSLNLVNRGGLSLDMSALRRPLMAVGSPLQSPTSMSMVNQYRIDLDDGLGQHDKKAFAKCCEILTFLIRDMAHVTLQNFESCIHCLRTFVEACVLGGKDELFCQICYNYFFISPFILFFLLMLFL